MSDNGQQVPLIERLRSVPAAARVLEHTPNPLGYDTTSIPVGALCQEAAARIAELERENDALHAELDGTRAELAQAREERDKARLYCAEVASYICDPMYDKVENRAGIAADAEAMATGEMTGRYLDIKMQTERAIRAEDELAAERERREADETDAARYRWLREWRARWEIRYWNGIYWNQLTTDELGAAIDAAIAAGRSED